MATKKKKGFIDTTFETIGGALNAAAESPESKAARERDELKRQQAQELAAQAAAQKDAPQAQPVDQANPEEPEEILDMDTGKKTGIRFPDGRTLLGLSEREIRGLMDNFNSKRITGTQPAGTARAEAERQQASLEAISAGQEIPISQGQLASTQGASPDFGQALGTGAISAAPGIVAGAVSGATIGALGGPIGAVGGAVAGAVGSFLLGFGASLRSQQKDAFAVDQQVLTKGDRYLRALITDTNRNPQNAAQNIGLFYQTLNMIDTAHAKTWRDSQENLNKWLGKDGTTELAKFEVFDTFQRQQYIRQMELAVGAPNPGVNLVTLEDMQEGAA